MKDAAPRHTGERADAVGHVSLATFPALPVVRAGLRHGSPVGLGNAQATLAAVLALGASFLKGRGLADAFLLGAAGVVLIVSGPPLVVWSDRDEGGKPPA